MNFGTVLSESIAFTRATLFEKWIRWLILILLALPWVALSFVVDATKIIDGTTIRWDLVPWGQVAPLILAGIVCSFFYSGYIVRLLRGGDTPPEFDNWAVLALDGIKMDVILLVWLLPAVILVLLQVLFFFGGSLAGGSPGVSLGVLFLMPVLMTIELAVFLFAVLYGIIGIIRFARTGSIREGFAISAIWATIGRIGWGNYIVALVVLVVIGFAFSLVTRLLSLIPFAGPILPTCLNPLLAVFRCRFISHVYDSSETVPAPEPSPAPSPVPGATGTIPPPAAAPAKDYVKWGLVLVVLMAICIIPLFLVLSATGIFAFPPMTMEELQQVKKDDISVYSKEGYFARPVFTGDGNKIMYLATTRPETKPPGREFGSSDWENDIWFMERDGTNQSRVTRVGDIQVFYYIPASGAIAYSHYGNGTTSVYILTNGSSQPSRIPGPLPFMYFSSWSPDGKRFAATGYNLSDYNGWGIMTGGFRVPLTDAGWSRLVLMNADGSSPQEVARVRPEQYYYVTESSWSPDGNRLAVPLFSSGGPGIGVIDTATGSTLQVTRDVDNYPRWSPNGGRIAFIRGGNVYAVSPDGSGEQRLVSDGTVDSLAWSPDGSRLAFSAESYLGIIDADGSDLTRISNIRPGPLSWSPDGTTIAYAPGMGVRIRIMPLTSGIIKMGEYMTKQMDRFSQAQRASST
jgi:Tol biopolymer transport system component